MSATYFPAATETATGPVRAPVRTITVELQNLNFQFFFLGGLMGFSNIAIPSMRTTITGEDLSTAAPTIIHLKNPHMQIYFFAAGIESDELKELEGRLRSKFPTLQTLSKLDEVTRRVAEQSATSVAETAFIIFPVLTAAPSFDRLVNIAEQVRRGVFFIFVSKEISASDYKRLVRAGGADWVSLTDAPREIEDIVSRVGRAQPAPAAGPDAKPKIVGVCSERAVVSATRRLPWKPPSNSSSTRRHAIGASACSTSTCRRAMSATTWISNHGCRCAKSWRAQSGWTHILFELFVSRHSSGVDVLASPRNRQDPVGLTMAALDVLFGMIAPRYDVLIVDLPSQWSAWTAAASCSLRSCSRVGHQYRARLAPSRGRSFGGEIRSTCPAQDRGRASTGASGSCWEASRAPNISPRCLVVKPS